MPGNDPSAGNAFGIEVPTAFRALSNGRSLWSSGSQLCFGITETLAPLTLRVRGDGFPHAIAFGKPLQNFFVEELRNDKKKGGRPKKAVKMDQLLGVKCTLIERKAIEARARSVGLSVSEYLRKIGLTGKIDRSERVFPKEALQFRGTLNHAAANINQIAHKRNRGDELNALERAELFNDVKTVVQASKAIIDYLK